MQSNTITLKKIHTHTTSVRQTVDVHMCEKRSFMRRNKTNIDDVKKKSSRSYIYCFKKP
jgi:hypothetical protein